MQTRIFILFLHSTDMGWKYTKKALGQRNIQKRKCYIIFCVLMPVNKRAPPPLKTGANSKVEELWDLATFTV